VRPAGKATRVREEQPKKAPLQMEVRPAGRLTEAREEQRWKALGPMEVRPAGKVTVVRVLADGGEGGGEGDATRAREVEQR